MDTRAKIVSAAEARRYGGTLVALVGYFDPVYDKHVRRIGEISREGDRLAAVIADPPEPLLPLRARAELVAGLAAVCYVIEAGSDIDGALRDLAPSTVIDERDADEERSRDLAAHVVERYRPE